MTIRIHLLLILLIFLLLYGCGGGLKQIRMTPEGWNYLKTQSEIQAAHYPSASLTVMTPGKGILQGWPAAVGGMAGLGATPLELGGAALMGLGLEIYGESLSRSSGAQMIKDYSLEDPILAVKEQFILYLVFNSDSKNIRFVQEPLRSDNINDLKKISGDGMVIDFKTIHIGLSYFLTYWGRYRIDYLVRARLIHLEDSKILWQGVCSYVGKDPKNSPTMDELAADNGALLKAKINEATDICAKELINQFFVQ